MQVLDSSQQTHDDYRELLEPTVLFCVIFYQVLFMAPERHDNYAQTHRGWWMTKLLQDLPVRPSPDVIRLLYLDQGTTNFLLHFPERYYNYGSLNVGRRLLCTCKLPIITLFRFALSSLPADTNCPRTDTGDTHYMCVRIVDCFHFDS